ncbi:uncharacterized protein E0L32_008337 [Thyridium curvatum]|uniref:Uncharacterized protein n=1 Tax=Thyridium curvatum TaxID=1093900 RepID=A0A507B1C4_9PEZI|nr:uncharacterized protein E0L32_008337 [Thyridium curvatum]TPX10768.1 hypothetical protein E0L32_008337 [Thyridium curvatum]
MLPFSLGTRPGSVLIPAPLPPPPPRPPRLLRRPPLPVDPVPPPFAPQHGRPHGAGAAKHEGRADGAEPAHPDGLDGGQHGRRAGRGEHVPDQVVARDDLGAAPGHDVEAVRVEAREGVQLRDALGEERDDHERDAAGVLLDGPAVDEQRGGDDAAHEGQRRPQAVLGDPGAAAPPDPLLGHVVRVPPAAERADEVPAPGREVEQPALQGGGEAEARVEHVPDRREHREHVPEERGRGDADEVQVRVAEEPHDAPGVHHGPQDAELSPQRQAREVVGLAVEDGLGQQEEDGRGGRAREARLQPEDDAPRGVGDDDAADDGAEGRPREPAREVPAEGGAALRGAVDVADDRGAHEDQRRALVGRAHPEDEKGREVGRQRRGQVAQEEGDRGRQHGGPAAVHLRQRAPEDGREAHAEHVQRVGDVDDGARGAVLGGDLGHGRQHRRAGHGRQEGDVGAHGHDDGLARGGQPVVEVVRDLDDGALRLDGRRHVRAEGVVGREPREGLVVVFVDVVVVVERAGRVTVLLRVRFRRGVGARGGRQGRAELYVVGPVWLDDRGVDARPRARARGR